MSFNATADISLTQDRRSSGNYAPSFKNNGDGSAKKYTHKKTNSKHSLY